MSLPKRVSEFKASMAALELDKKNLIEILEDLTGNELLPNVNNFLPEKCSIDLISINYLEGGKFNLDMLLYQNNQKFNPKKKLPFNFSKIKEEMASTVNNFCQKYKIDTCNLDIAYYGQ
jgi:hypothetical protein